MKLDENDIDKMEKVGDSDKGEVLHVATKGGLHLIVCKSQAGLAVLGQGLHRAYARKMAQKGHKVNWNDALFKTEELEFVNHVEAQPLNKADTYDPHKHYAQAKFHSQMAGKFANRPVAPEDYAGQHDNTMMRLIHTHDALKHYRMAGMDHSQAEAEHQKLANTHKELASDKSPHNGYELELLYNRTFPNKPIKIGKY